MKYALSTLLLLLGTSTGLAQAGGAGELLWTEEAKLRNIAGEANDVFGHSIALDGDTALIGATFSDEACPGASLCNSGSAFVFVRSGTSWSPQAKLLANDAATLDWFGYHLDVSGDVAAVTAHGRSSVYLFLRSGTTWAQEATLNGGAVSLDGETLAIGVVGGYGKVKVHERGDGSWPRVLQRGPSDGLWGSKFGASVSLDGAWLFVGAPEDDDCGIGSGSVYVFQRSGGTWIEQSKLTASDGSPADNFGCSISLSGTTALIGAVDDSSSGMRSGSAYVFERSGSSWNQQAKLVPSDGSAYDHFGYRVSVSGDRALVATNGGPEHAYLFVRSGWTWREESPIETHENTTGFGNGVAIDGDTALVSSPWNNEGRGAAYVFTPALNAGTGYCFGDPGSGTPCPCSNDNDGSVPGSGCDNGVFASGAHLMAYGNASVSDDTLVLRATHVEPFNSGLFFQANNRVGGGDGSVFGDGLRCAGGGLVRLQVIFAGSHASIQSTIAIGSKGTVTAGDTKRYQYWYRTTAAPPCGILVNDFNLSNGYEVAWLP